MTLNLHDWNRGAELNGICRQARYYASPDIKEDQPSLARGAREILKKMRSEF
jgi:hypothetical protein